MNTKYISRALIAFGLLLTASNISAAVSAPLRSGVVTPTVSHMTTVQDCYIDDGYGRRTSCDSFFKERETINRPIHENCTIDDGYGRKVSCSAFIKERQASEKKQ